MPSSVTSKSSEPSSVPSVPKEEEDERSGPLWRVLVLVALVVCWEVSKMSYDSPNEWRVAKKQLRKMRHKPLPSGPPSVELQAPIPGVLSWMMIAIARCHKEPRAIVCSIGSTIRVQGAVGLAFVESIQVTRAIVDAILCAIQVKRAIVCSIGAQRRGRRKVWTVVASTNTSGTGSLL
jgi:hypothetical protein